mmetsp:Transcript_75686/g.149589  ORF Transcript_75686/g.149589 Transcript_75686/m.149589 type:complete len:348 (+) Transcript_75686:60-1103(+)
MSFTTASRTASLRGVHSRYAGPRRCARRASERPRPGYLEDDLPPAARSSTPAARSSAELLRQASEAHKVLYRTLLSTPDVPKSQKALTGEEQHSGGFLESASKRSALVGDVRADTPDTPSTCAPSIQHSPRCCRSSGDLQSVNSPTVRARSSREVHRSSNKYTLGAHFKHVIPCRFYSGETHRSPRIARDPGFESSRMQALLCGLQEGAAEAIFRRTLGVKAKRVPSTSRLHVDVKSVPNHTGCCHRVINGLQRSNLAMVLAPRMSDPPVRRAISSSVRAEGAFKDKLSKSQFALEDASERKGRLVRDREFADLCARAEVTSRHRPRDLMRMRNESHSMGRLLAWNS